MLRIMVITLVLCSQIFSQNVEEASRGNWSIYGGISSMSASADSYEYSTVDAGRKMGFNVGAMRTISEKWTVGFGYTQRGWTDSAYYTDLMVNVDEDWTFSGIELWGTYNIFPAGNGNFWIGPSLLIMNSAEVEFDVQNGGSVSQDADVDENDLSLLLGISIPVGGNGSALNLGYQRSLKEVDDFVIFNQFFVDFSFPIN